MISLPVVDSMHFQMKFLLLLLLFIPLGAMADQDSDFLAARDAFRAGNAARLESYAARLKGSSLEPYLAYYRLRLKLETTDTAAIQAFLARTDETPVIDRLRGEWLKFLGKKHQWDVFAAEYPHLINEDTELSCYEMQALWRTQETEVLQKARNFWLTGNDDLPESCTPLFEAALTNGVISEADVWLRMRLALEAGNVSLAKQLSAKLPLERRLSAVQLDHAAADPLHYLNNAKLKDSTEAEHRVALFALQRLAKQLPQLAWVQWEKISANFNLNEQHYFFAWLAYEAAIRQDPRAVEWFKTADGTTLTEAQHAWRARAALRVQNWQEVRASIVAMPPQEQQEGVWRYWNARALKQLGRDEEAAKIFLALSSEYNFYGQLASDELGMPIAVNTKPVGFQTGKNEIDAMLTQPGIQRTLALYRMDLRSDALREWAWTIRKFDDKQLLIAAEIARRNQMYDRSINTADRTVQLHDFSLRYPAPYREDLRGHIQENQLEEAWVYGLMRQESRFVTQAKSNVGAAGLMQVMPTTAKWIARKLGMSDYRKKQVSNMETNLIFGTYYMKTVLGWFDNNPVLASAAYNAGPSHARQWRGDSPLEGAIYTETIPFTETRDYVKKVMSNTVYYAQQFGQPPRSLKQRLGIIAAKNSANQAPIPDEK